VPNAARRIYEPESAHVARMFLNELRGAHRNLMARMQDLDNLSAEDQPDHTAVATARWKLGQASLSRRLLVGRICEYFIGRRNGAQTVELSRLQMADRELLGISANHLSKWTAETISRDWRGYRSAGSAIRRQTYDHIAIEQRVLYPLLEQATRA
jgi:hypothetical protein